MLYKFADIVVKINFKHDFGKEYCKEYEVSEALVPDFEINVTDEMMEKERQKDLYNSPDKYLESLSAYRAFCDKALDYDCIFFHCSSLAYKNNGILFTAPSGTGKSTHTALWRKTFGDDVVMINDDKPLIRKLDGNYYVYGTPWDGKHRISNNVSAPVKAVVLLEQGKENKLSLLNKRQTIFTVLNQTVRPDNPGKMNKVLNFIEGFTKSVPFYKLTCDISEQAVLTAYNGIKENFYEN